VKLVRLLTVEKQLQHHLFGSPVPHLNCDPVQFQLCFLVIHLPQKVDMKQSLPPALPTPGLVAVVSAAAAALKWYIWISMKPGVPYALL
jgi:hypothetical protein